MESEKTLKEQCERIRSIFEGCSKLYCDCGCQNPEKFKVPNIDVISLKYRNPDYFNPNPINIYKNGDIIGSVDPSRNYICMNGIEYLGIKECTDLGDIVKKANIEMHQSSRLNDPCNNCGTYCFSDCVSDL